ncbi:MAG TPA: hypothetical protein VN641_21410 [Urbifossiella sp.]|nr:hypothetical protein [Urbifossiella sp.]
MPAMVVQRASRLAAAAVLFISLAAVAEETKPTAPAPAPRPVRPAAPPINPRGEALLFENNSIEIRPTSPNWWSVSVSPDGKRLATTEGDSQGKKGAVRIWDRGTGKVIKLFEEPNGTRAVAFSPDGKLLATGNYDSTLRVYDANTFQVLAASDEKLGGHKNGINGICFFKDSKRIATAGLDNTSRVWDLAAISIKSKAPLVLSPIAIFEGHTQGLLSVAISEDGRTLLSGSFDRTARCYDIPEKLPAMGQPPLAVKKERVVLKGHSNTIETVAISPDGKLLATGGWDSQLLIRDREGKKTEATVRFQAGVMCCEFSKDGKYIVAGSGNMTSPSQNGEIRVWDIAKNQQVGYRGDGGPAVLGATFLDSKTVVSVGHEEAVHLWEFKDNNRKTFTAGGLAFSPQPYAAAALSPSGTFLAVSGENKSVMVLDRLQNKLIAELTGHDDVVAGLAFSPDGQTLATASFDKTVKLWDTATWKARRTLKGHAGWVLGVAYSPDSRTLATASYDKTVRLWNAATGEQKASWSEHKAGVRTVAFSPDGTKLASGGSDRAVRIWNVAEGRVLFTCKGHKNALRSVVFSPNGQFVASGSEDRHVKLWNAATGQEAQTFGVLPDMAVAVRFSPKGQTLVAATFQGPIVVLDPLTGRTRQTLRAHNEPTTDIAFTRDGDKLISVSQDRTIRQWSPMKAADGPSLQTFRGQSRIATAIAVAPDGRRAITGDEAGTLSFWNALSGGRAAALEKAHAGAIEHIAWSPDQAVVVSVGKDNTVQTWGKQRQRLWSTSGRFAAVSPDSKLLAVADGKDIVLREAATGKETKRLFAGHQGNVIRVAFGPKNLLLSAGNDTKVRIWNAATGEKLQETPAFGNYSAITQMAIAPDGSRFAVAAYGPDQAPPEDMDGQFRVTREVRVYAVPTAKAEIGSPIAFSPQPSDQPITGLDWLANGKTLVTPASDGTVRLTEIGANPPTPMQRQPQNFNQQPAQPPNNAAAREVKRYRAHDSAVLAAAVLPDSRLLLTTGEDMTIKRWALPGVDAAPGLVRLTSPGLTRVWEMLPSPAGNYVIAAGEGDKTFRVYSQLPSTLTVEPDKHGPVFALAYSPDNRYLVTAHDKGVLVVRDAGNGRVLRFLPGLVNRAASIAFGEKGAALVAVGGNSAKGSDGGEAVVWDFVSGTIRFHLQAAANQNMVAVHADGTMAAGAGADGKLRLWILATGHLVKELNADSAVESVAFDHTGQRVAIATANHLIRVYEVASDVAPVEFSANKKLKQSHAIFSPDGSEIVVASWRGTGPLELKAELAAYSLKKTSAPPRLFTIPTAALLSLGFLADGKTLVAAGGEENNAGFIRFFDFGSAKPTGSFTGHRQVVRALAISPDGARMASTGVGEMRFWTTRGLRPIAEIKVPDENEYLSCAAISTDGKRLVLGGWGKTLSAWDMADPAHPKLLKQFADHKAGLRSIGFDAAGRRFASTDESGKVIVWDAMKLAPIVSIQASANAIYRAKFTLDGTALVTASGNWKAKAKGELRVWDPATGKETGRFPDQSLEVWDIGFLDGGKRMITIGAIGGSQDDAHVKVWDFATKQVVNRPVGNGAFKSARCLAVSPDGKRLAIGSGTGPVKVFDTGSWQEVLDLPGLANCTFRVDFARDGCLLVASGDGAGIAVRVP